MSEISPDPQLDLDALTRFLDARGLGAGPVTQRFLSGGSQNLLFDVQRGDDFRAALRIPPPSAPADRDAGILREWQIIEALSGSAVAHTPAIAACDDPSILGRTFYLMGFVDGWSPMDGGWPEPFVSDESMRPALAYQLIEGIAELSTFDWQAAGLQELGRPDGFHERQVSRWTGFLERIKGRELPGFEEATRWLDAHKPLDFIPGLMHGDYQFANVMFKHGAPAELAAIVDWEMGTVGDPKLDLAWVVQGWPEDTSQGQGLGYVDITGMPGRTALIEHYARCSGRQVDDIDYYVVLAKWKLAIVLEQGFQRAGGNRKLAMFGPIVLNLMRGAAELAESTDYKGVSL